MSSEYEWGRHQARFNGGGWRNDFTQAESDGYHYQRSLDEQQKFMREEDERRSQADEARRRAAQAGASCYGSGDAGFGYGGASSGTVGGGAAQGGGDPTGLVVIGIVLGGFAIVWLWKLILALLLIAATFFLSIYTYDLCRHRRGIRSMGVVLDGIADDAERGFLAGLQWLAVRCRGGQQRATCTAARLAHRACIADSVPTRIRSRAGRAALRRARRVTLIASRWAVQGLARLAQVTAWSLEWLHAA